MNYSENNMAIFSRATFLPRAYIARRIYIYSRDVSHKFNSYYRLLEITADHYFRVQSDSVRRKLEKRPGIVIQM